MIEINRPRVLHLTTTGAIAGAEKLLIDLAETHDRSSWDVSYCTLFPAGEMNALIEKSGNRCYALDLLKGGELLSAASRLRTIIDNEKIDLLHTHLHHASLVGLIATKMYPARKPILVHTRHYTDEMHRYHSRPKALLDGYLARKQDHVFAISKTAQDALISLDRVKTGKISVNRPGVIVERLWDRVDGNAAVALRQSLQPSGPIVGVIARLVEKKGHKHLLDIAPALIAAVPELKILFAGDGPERANLERQVDSLGIKGSVQFLGYRDDIPTVISALDVVVQPSLEEGLPVSLIEAMALGKPVVASNISGIPELVVDCVTGLLIESGNSSALLTALTTLLCDQVMLTAMSVAAMRRVASDFTMERHARQYETGWAEALNRTKQKPV